MSMSRQESEQSDVSAADTVTTSTEEEDDFQSPHMSSESEEDTHIVRSGDSSIKEQSSPATSHSEAVEDKTARVFSLQSEPETPSALSTSKEPALERVDEDAPLSESVLSPRDTIDSVSLAAHSPSLRSSTWRNSIASSTPASPALNGQTFSGRPSKRRDVKSMSSYRSGGNDQFELMLGNRLDELRSVDMEQMQSRRKSMQELFERKREEEKNEADGVIDWDFWGDVISDYEKVAREEPKKLSKAIQQGIPSTLRGIMWQLMSSAKDTELEAIYSSLLKQNSTHEKAIMRDLSRTFPNHEYFKEGGIPGTGTGQENLFNVVKAYSLYDEEVGYCQGLQFIVGPLLLNMPDEEAFCVLVRLMKSYGLRTHYSPNMPGLQMRLFQFDRLVEELVPAVFLHLLKQGVKSSMYASQWFLTLFGYRFPMELVNSVMDLVFAEGVEAVFRFSVSLLKRNEDEILQLEFEQLLDFLKNKLFEPWRALDEDGEPDEEAETAYKAQDFVRDALSIKITPILLDQFANEWDNMRKEQDAQANELNNLRKINAQLSLQVRSLEASLAQINEEHCDLVKQVVMSKLEREEIEEELVKYKVAFAELSHRKDSMSANSPLISPVVTPVKETSGARVSTISSTASSFFSGIRPTWGKKPTELTPSPLESPPGERPPST